MRTVCRDNPLFVPGTPSSAGRPTKNKRRGRHSSDDNWSHQGHIMPHQFDQNEKTARELNVMIMAPEGYNKKIKKADSRKLFTPFPVNVPTDYDTFESDIFEQKQSNTSKY